MFKHKVYLNIVKATVLSSIAEIDPFRHNIWYTVRINGGQYFWCVLVV